MSSFREREGRQSWDRRVLVSYWQKLEGLFSSFFPQLSLLLWMLRLEEKGLSDPQLAVSRLVLCPNQLQVTLRLTTCPLPCPSVLAAEERVADINRSLDFASEYISSYFVQKKVHSSELPAPSIYASLHSYLRSEKYTISCEKTKRPSLPPAYVLS